MWWLLLSQAAQAQSPETAVVIRLTDPTGATILTQDAALLPLDTSREQSWGKGSFRVSVTAGAAGDGAAGELVLTAIGRREKELARAPLTVGASGAATAALTTAAPKKAVGPDGAALTELTWRVEARMVPQWDAPAYDPEPPYEWPVNRFAVVRSGAGLFGDPMAKQADEQLGAAPQGGSPFRIVARWEGQRVEVESVPKDLAPHCAAAAEGLRPYTYQYFVDKADLSLVLTAPLRHDYKDGTAISLVPGVPVTPGAGGSAGLRLSTSVDEALTDLRYPPAGHFAVAETGWLLYPRSDGVLGTLDGRPVTAASADPWPVQGRRGITAPRVTVRTACAELVLRVDPDQLRPAP